MFCQNCGKKNMVNAVYCTSCGSKLLESSLDLESKNLAEEKKNNAMQTGNIESGQKKSTINLINKFENAFGKETWKKIVGIAVAIIVLLFMFNFIRGFITGFREGFRDAYYDDIEITSEIALYGEPDATTRTTHIIKEKTKVADFIKNDTNAVLFSDGEIKSLAGITAEPQNGLVWRFFIDYETPIPANGDYILNDGEIITFNLDYVN